MDTLALQNAKKNTNNVNGQGEKGASSDDLQKEGDVIMLQDIIPVAHPEPSSWQYYKGFMHTKRKKVVLIFYTFRLFYYHFH